MIMVPPFQFVCTMVTIIYCSVLDHGKCIHILDRVMDKVLGYMFKKCTGVPPLTKIMEGEEHKLPPRAKQPPLGCRCDTD